MMLTLRAVCQQVMRPLLSALEFLHKKKIIHRCARDGGRWQPTSVRSALRGRPACRPALMRALVGAPLARRDVKPENLLIDHTGTLKLCDLGCGPHERARPRCGKRATRAARVGLSPPRLSLAR